MSAIVRNTEAAALPGAERNVYRVAKRVLDLFVSLSVLVIGAPLLLAAALAVKLDSSGPVIFSQRRVGLNGREFVLYKFRTMTCGADDAPHREAFRKYAAGEPIEVDEHGPRFKASRDPRVTRVGRVLRAANIDELLQLFNVIKGEMSIVGPRPAIPYELEWYRPEYHECFRFPPGITGRWQVTDDRFRVGMDTMMADDLAYVSGRGLLVDIKLIAATAAMLLRELRKGIALAAVRSAQ